MGSDSEPLVAGAAGTHTSHGSTDATRLGGHGGRYGSDSGERAAGAGQHTIRRRPRYCGGRLSFDSVNLGVLSVGFLLLFLAYNTLQNYVTSLLPGHLGANSLAVLYCTAAASAFAAPVVVYHMGNTVTLVLGGACYVAYLASLIHIVEPVVYAASAVIGFGAAILWVAFGVYISRLSEGSQRQGGYVGIFWSVFQLSSVIGNFGGYLVFDDVSNSPWFYATFTIVAAAGTLLLATLARVPDAPSTGLKSGLDQSDDGDGDPRSPAQLPQTVCGLLNQTRQTMGNRVILLLVPMFFWTGFELAAWTGSFPQLLPHNTIGLVMTLTGVGEAVSGWGLGRLGDKVGRSAATIFGCVVYAAALIMTQMLRAGYGWAEHSIIVDGAPWLAFVAALCYGVADSAFNTQTYALLSDKMKDAHSFTLFQLAQNVGSAVGFYYGESFPLTGSGGSATQLVVQAAVMVVAVAGLVAVDRNWCGTSVPPAVAHYQRGSLLPPVTGFKLVIDDDLSVRSR